MRPARTTAATAATGSHAGTAAAAACGADGPRLTSRAVRLKEPIFELSIQLT